MPQKSSYLPIEALCCPHCQTALVSGDDRLSCPDCQRDYPQVGGCWIFTEVDRALIHDPTDRIKYCFKRFPRLYYFIITLFSPVLVRRRHERFARKQEGLVLNLGSGNSRIGERVVNIDCFDYEQVDVVADIHHLPFRDNSVDGVLDIAVLEHVRDPAAILREVYRVLKPGGFVYSIIPFMQPFHASPHDYQRYTRPGIEHLHRDFERVDSGAYSGPVSGFVWNLQEFLALVFSLGWKPLRDILSVCFMLLLWPLKFLDLYFHRLPSAENMASTFFFHGRKPS